MVYASRSLILKIIHLVNNKSPFFFITPLRRFVQLALRNSKCVRIFYGQSDTLTNVIGYCSAEDKDKPVFSPKHLSWEKWSYEDALMANQGEWNIKADHWKYRWFDKEENRYYYYDLDLNVDDKWKISGGMTYEYLIFDDEIN